jgi:cell pole-organizing protein PopZ
MVVAPPVTAAPSPAAAPAVAAEPPVRTLEDAVAEMLRPMLQQWLTDHMPRIIERALRVETAKTVKDVTK